jgi:hypothetical protein
MDAVESRVEQLLRESRERIAAGRSAIQAAAAEASLKAIEAAQAGVNMMPSEAPVFKNCGCSQRKAATLEKTDEMKAWIKDWMHRHANESSQDGTV